MGAAGTSSCRFAGAPAANGCLKRSHLVSAPDACLQLISETMFPRMQAWHTKVQQACLDSGAPVQSTVGGSLSFTAQQQLEGSPDMRHLRARNESLHRMAERLQGQVVTARKEGVQLATTVVKLQKRLHAAEMRDAEGACLSRPKLAVQGATPTWQRCTL